MSENTQDIRYFWILFGTTVTTMTDPTYAQRATHNGAMSRTGPKPVFVAVRDIPSSTSKPPPTGEEFYYSLMKCVKTEHISGIQRIGSLWRIYLSNHEERVKVIVNGLFIRGATVPVHDVNPYTKAKDEHLTRVLIKDVPLSVGDDQIRTTLQTMKYTVRGEITRQQLRVGGQLTNCLNGDRIVYIDPPSQPLPRFLTVATLFRARAFHAGQPEKRDTVNATCSKCLDSGHHASTCPNQVKCRICKQSGHYGYQCNASSNTSQNVDNGTAEPTGTPTNDSPASPTRQTADNTRREALRKPEGDPQKDGNTRVRRPRQADISDFLKSCRVNDAAAAPQDLRQGASDQESVSQYSTTRDDEDESSSCYLSSGEDEHSPISPETPTPDKKGKTSTKRKLKGKKKSKKSECKGKH